MNYEVVSEILGAEDSELGSDKYRMPWGKYKGCAIDQVPSPYLTWLYEQKPKEPVYSILAMELSRRYALPDPEERKRVREALKKFCEGL